MTFVTCQQHGVFESKSIEVKGLTINTSCPTCFDIRVKKLNDDRADELYRGLQQSKLNAMIEKAGIPKRFARATLESFRTPTPEHLVALETAKKYLSQIVLGGEEKLVMCGTTGTGKTHLGCAIARAFMERTGRPACYTKASVLCDYIHDEMFRSSSSITAMIPKIIRDGLLVLDEVGAFGSDKPFQMSVLSESIDYCINNELPIMMISNLDQDALSVALGGDRSIDRMNEGSVMSISMVYESHRGSAL